MLRPIPLLFAAVLVLAVCLPAFSSDAETSELKPGIYPGTDESVAQMRTMITDPLVIKIADDAALELGKKWRCATVTALKSRAAGYEFKVGYPESDLAWPRSYYVGPKWVKFTKHLWDVPGKPENAYDAAEDGGGSSTYMLEPGRGLVARNPYHSEEELNADFPDRDLRTLRLAPGKNALLIEYSVAHRDSSVNDKPRGTLVETCRRGGVRKFGSKESDTECRFDLPESLFYPGRFALSYSLCTKK